MLLPDEKETREPRSLTPPSQPEASQVPDPREADGGTAPAPKAHVGTVGGKRLRTLPIHSLLTRCNSPELPFEWTLNPYRGCAFACRYCYARYTHEWLGLDGDEDFDTQIFLKQDIDQVLARDLARLRRHRNTRARNIRARNIGVGGHSGDPPRPGRDRIAMGTASDPYQPAEHRYGLTRACLRVFLREESRHPEGHDVGITTKSDLIVRDIDLLQRLPESNRIHVNVSITTLDRGLARKLEPGAPGPQARLQAMASLLAAGIEVNAFVMPILPQLNDRTEDLEALFGALAETGVHRVVCEAVFLRSPTREVFLAFLARQFPELEAEYRRRFSESQYASPLYVERLRSRVHRLRERFGLTGAHRGSGDSIPRLLARWERSRDTGTSGGGGPRLRRKTRMPRSSPPRSESGCQLHLFDDD